MNRSLTNKIVNVLKSHGKNCRGFFCLKVVTVYKDGGINLQLCPYCGHALPHTIKSGIGTCINCSRVFDTSPFNRLLSAGWLVRRQDICHESQLEAYGFSFEEAVFVIAFVSANGFSHDEFIKVLTKLGVSSQLIDLE